MASSILETALIYCFPDDEERESVQKLLRGIPESERERVSVAVLRLSDGEPQELRRNVEAACRDYRDLLAWSEYDAEFALGPSPAKERVDEARAADAAAAQAWLRKIGYP